MDEARSPIEWPSLLDRAIGGVGVHSLYQPIIDLRRCTIAGFEALTRFDIGPPVGPDVWFEQAHLHGVGELLEATALRSALSMRSHLPDNTFMTINVEPESLSSPVIESLLIDQGSLSGLVIEITEHRPIHDPAHGAWVLQRLRQLGAMIAIDDAGSGYAGLQQILALRPHILKLDRALVEGIDRDEAKAALAEMLGIFANRIDAWLLAEGIETRGEALRCVTLGIPLAQGFFFARPAPPWQVIRADAALEVMAFSQQTGSPTLHELLVHMPSVYEHDVSRASQLFADSAVTHVVAVTNEGRPTGIITPSSLMAGELLQTLHANVYTNPSDIAQRLATSAASDTVMPVIVTDPQGRYIGTVTIRRLLATLARERTRRETAGV
ncbi:MAG: EAL domain-containing protein [Ilumatobacteraceae bacterium]